MHLLEVITILQKKPTRKEKEKEKKKAREAGDLDKKTDGKYTSQVF